MTAAPEPFVIVVPDAVLDAVQQRLALTRWPDEIPAAGWQDDSNLSSIQKLVHYWQHQYDWRTHERLRNSFPQYRVHLDDLTLYSIHQPGVASAPMPLLLSRCGGVPARDYPSATQVGGAGVPSAALDSHGRGHFAALEEPQALVEDIRAFYRELR